VATAAGGQQEASDIARLARALVAAYTNTGRTFGANRLLGGGNNWRLRVMMSDDSFFSNAADWNFGGTGACACVRACVRVCVCMCVFAQGL
jgi:hypothetical protein